MTLSHDLGAFAARLTLDDIPVDVLEKARACVLNGFGIALGSFPTPYTRVASASAECLYGAGPSSVLVDGSRTTIDGAIQANAALFHGRAQEDTCGTSHLGAILLPLLVSLAETGHGAMHDFLPAVVAGYEVGGALEREHSAVTTGRGFRASPLYGTVAAAAAAARFMRLNEKQTAAAIGNAASFAGGVLQSFADGTDEWRYQVGVAARIGLTSAMLARHGSVSAPHALEGNAGLIPSYAGQDCRVEAIRDQLGKAWSVMRVTFKPYPVCALNQTPVGAILELREQAGFDVALVEQVSVRMNPTAVGYAGMDAHGPFDSVGGTLMSVPFCVAVALLHGIPSIAAMTRYDDDAVNALEKRVALIADPAYDLLGCRIDVHLTGHAEPLVMTRNLDFSAYSYSWNEVSDLIRRVGHEVGIPGVAFDRLEHFVTALPDVSMDELLDVFAIAREQAAGTPI